MNQRQTNTVTNRIPVLTYHSLDESDSPISMSPQKFRWQMEYLRDRNWRTLTLKELLDGHACGGWPTRTLALTFDDGFTNFAEQALPILTACGFSATLFVVPDWIGRTNILPSQPRRMPRLDVMDWETVGNVANAGIEIGAHSLTHPHLTHLTMDEARHEIIESQRAIEDRIGRPVQAFAYPYGERSWMLEEIVRRHFRGGFGTRLEFVSPSSRTSALGRIDAYYLRDQGFFRALVAGELGGYIRVRHWLRTLRHKDG